MYECVASPAAQAPVSTGSIVLVVVWLMLLAALIAALPAGHAVAMTADEYFTDGNRLYYNDLYWAALLRYQQAADEGLDSAVLHYNMGVAHYRAGQLVRSRQEFERGFFYD